MTNAHSIDTSVSKQPKKRVTDTKSFIARAIEVHGNRYDYSKVDYVKTKDKVFIVCEEHGIFSQTPNAHLSGKGCDSCGGSKTITTDGFKKRAIKLHDGYYTYDKVEYIRNSNKVTITCPVHGDFKQTPSQHLLPRGCEKCGYLASGAASSSNTLEFVLKAIKVHGSTYSYENVIYERAIKKVSVTCKKHGDFKITPNKHLGGGGCQHCWRDRLGSLNLKTHEQFLKKAMVRHGDYYCYKKSKYEGAEIHLTITCENHGDFTQSPNAHLQGQGCPSCGRIKQSESRSSNTNEFIEKSVLVHGNKYDYSDVNYKNNTTKVIINCYEHGKFQQRPSNHLNGNECPSCSIALSGFKRSIFKNRCDKKNKGLGALYIIRCVKGSEIFYKIGITSQTVQKRYSSTKAMPYDYKIVSIIDGGADFIFDLEKTIHRILKKHRHKPSIGFGGESECFVTIKPINSLIKELTTTKQIQLLA